MSATSAGPRLEKQLSLIDVYAICTGAMFSSGFFLLPGLAFAQTGKSVILAYLLAGLLAAPALLSKAELATAMPRAGGTYFYLDRSFGPLIGTVGGLGTWLAMVLKTAFAFVGIGVYLALVVDVDGTTLSVLLTLGFLALNLIGAREASLVQQVLVVTLLAILGLLVAQGLWLVAQGGAPVTASAPPFLRDGVGGLMSTTGLVFVSYAGVSQVASVAEEVKDPERNIPLGMALSLLSAILIYSLGAYVLITLLEPLALARPDLTPVASAAEVVFAWLPEPIGVWLVVIAAGGAFASTGNAALLAASRYLFALARDERIPERLARLSRSGTPVWGLLASAAAVLAAMLCLDVAQVAKLASAFLLVVFALENLALIVMRESRLESYDPGFRCPLYPWVQILGVVGPPLILAEMGPFAHLFTAGVIALSVAWYLLYGRAPEASSGAIYHLLARLVEQHHAAVARLSASLEEGVAADELDLELRGIIGERGLRERDPYDEVVARALSQDVEPEGGYGELARLAARLVAPRLGLDPDDLADSLLTSSPDGGLLVESGVALHHLRLLGLARPELVLLRCREGLTLDTAQRAAARGGRARCHAMIFLFSPEEDPGQHLRLLAHLAVQIEREGFGAEWLAADGPHALHETLLRFERFLSIRLRPGAPSGELIGRRIRELDLPETTLVAAVRRGDHVIFPRGEHVLQVGDRVTIVGPPEAIQELDRRWRSPAADPAP